LLFLGCNVQSVSSRSKYIWMDSACSKTCCKTASLGCICRYTTVEVIMTLGPYLPDGLCLSPCLL
jgi:hypothetical protein